MKWRYILWYSIIFIVHFSSWYYALAFCTVYVNSSSGWINGCIISLALDLLGFQLASSIVKGIIRGIIHCWPNR